MKMKIFKTKISLERAYIHRYDIYFCLILILYIIMAIVLFKNYMYQINNDGIVYINISKQILAGNFYNSINDYWGPLISWLMLPFIYFSKNPVETLYSAKITSIIIGFITLFGIRKLSYMFEMEGLIRTLIILTTVPVVLYFALSYITPDLLMVCVLIYYLAIIYDLNYSKKITNGLLCGFLGAFAYFTKSYGFTFFIASFIIFNILHYLTEADGKDVLKNLAAGFAVFLIISSAWIGLISYKSGKFTYGSSGDYNYALVGPNSSGFADYSEGLHQPNQVNTNYLPKSWSPFSSWTNFNHQITLIWNNSQKTWMILNYFSALSLLIILIYILLLIVPPRNVSRLDLAYPLLTICILTVGYLMVVVEERYIWLVYVLLIMMGGYLINKLFKTSIFKVPNFGKIFKILCMLGFIFLMVLMPINYLAQNLNTGMDSYTLSNTLTSYGVHGNVATNDQLTEMNYLTYYMNISSYGQSEKNISSTKLRQDLKTYGINYYFIWGNSEQESYMKDFVDVIYVPSANLKIYQIS